MTDARALYQAIIVEHDRHPRNAGPLATATHHGAVDNPLCGDEVTVHVEVDGAGAIAAVTFEARGCALARAAASLMTERVRGLDRAAVAALVERFAGFVRTDAVDAVTDATDLGDLTAFVGVRQFRSRQACATLPFRALVAALG
ncbi:MAG: SUF system NifU family Fe-S cluster assembly protein [Myxococcales bacterium]|nr:SUF system NifU family Fe-S cluster assembly protein [Myxococcales bacterium]